MAEPGLKPALKKPPGYKDPNSPSPGQIPPKPVRRPLPPTFYHTQKSSRRKCCRLCCCCVCFLILFLIIFLAIAGGLFYLWFTPKLPVFKLLPVQLQRFNITTKRDGSAFLNSAMTIWVEVRNPNEKLRIYYGDTQISLMADGDTDLGSASIGGFTQEKMNVTVLKFTTRMEGEEIDESTAKRLSSRVKSQSVLIDFEGKTKVGVGVGSLKIGMLGINVNCGDMSLKQLNDGDPPKCTINTLKWQFFPVSGGGEFANRILLPQRATRPNNDQHTLNRNPMPSVHAMLGLVGVAAVSTRASLVFMSYSFTWK